MELLESQSHRVALSAVPRIFFIKFLRLGEDIQAILQSWVSIDVHVLVLVLYGDWFPEEDLKFNFLVTFRKEFGEGAVEGLGKVATVAFFIAKLAHVSGSFEVVDVHLYADFISQCPQSLGKVFYNLIPSLIQPIFLAFLIFPLFNLRLFTLYNLRIVFDLGPVIHLHGICSIYCFFILSKVSLDDLQPKGAEGVLMIFH